MKNKAVIAIIAILVLGGGGYGAYRVYKHFSRLASPVAQVVQQATQASPKTLKDLLGLSSAQKCTYSGGVVYVSGGKVRGDFSTQEQGQSVNSHMIVDGNTSYIWTEGQKTGIKTTFEANAGTNPSTSASPEAGQSGAMDAQTPQDYKCEGWSADPTLFSLPAGVTFQDMSALIPSMPPTQTAPNIPAGY